MRLIKPSIKFLCSTPKPLQAIEKAGRTCYKSEDKITEGSAKEFVTMLLCRKHDAMIEHVSASYRFICDRGVSHEIVRHRLFSYAQESTRYCNYKGGVTFIIPCWFKKSRAESMLGEWDSDIDIACDEAYKDSAGVWFFQMMRAEKIYTELLLRDRWTPQQARSVLPNSLKTEIVVTGNLREWRHFFKLRCAAAAHPQMREVANMVLKDIRKRVPVIFEELG